MNVNKEYDLERFISAQERDYDTALNEMKAGHKVNHWIWYIFPQLAGLGTSYASNYYGIVNSEEAKCYLAHPVLGARLFEITETILNLKDNDPLKLMGSQIDKIKLQASMTLFAYVSGKDSIFARVLEKYFGWKTHDETISMLNHADN